jgi:hypothetical protein
MFDTSVSFVELSIDFPAESSRKSKKRKAKDAAGMKEKKLKKSKSRSGSKAERSVEINYEEGTDVEDEPPDVMIFCLKGVLHFSVQLYLLSTCNY